MRYFRDSLDRAWIVRLDLAAMRRIAAVAGVDLVAELAASAAAIVSDPVKLAEALYAVCMPQADQRGIDQAGFEKGLNGDAGERASAALMDALDDSLPRIEDFPKAKEKEKPKEESEKRDAWRAIYDLAGAAGIDPMPLTQRELVWIYCSRGLAEWDHTALAVATLINVNVTKQEHRVDPATINPFRAGEAAAAARRSDEPLKADLGILKTMFFAQKGKQPKPASPIRPAERTNDE